MAVSLSQVSYTEYESVGPVDSNPPTLMVYLQTQSELNRKTSLGSVKGSGNSPPPLSILCSLL